MISPKTSVVAEFEEEGFFTHIRNMDYLQIESVRAIEAIENLNIAELSLGDKMEVVELLWSMPYYALRFAKACVEMGADEQDYHKMVGALHSAVKLKIKEILRSYSQL